MDRGVMKKVEDIKTEVRFIHRDTNLRDWIDQHPDLEFVEECNEGSGKSFVVVKYFNWYVGILDKRLNDDPQIENKGLLVNRNVFEAFEVFPETVGVWRKSQWD